MIPKIKTEIYTIAGAIKSGIEERLGQR